MQSPYSTDRSLCEIDILLHKILSLVSTVHDALVTDRLTRIEYILRLFNMCLWALQS